MQTNSNNINTLYYFQFYFLIIFIVQICIVCIYIKGVIYNNWEIR